MMVQMLTVIVNTVLAPVLISGWGTHHAFGTAGAGLASSIAIGCGVVFLWVYFARLEHYVALHPRQWAPRWSVIRRILNVGLPAGGEFFMLFVILGAVYWVIRGFGPAAQAGFGIGGRVMQALFLPVMAVAFAVAPVAGQNFGAHQYARVRETFRTAAILSCAADARSSRSCASGARSGSSKASRARQTPVVGSAPLTCASFPGTSSRPGSSSPARACSRHSATPGPRS